MGIPNINIYQLFSEQNNNRELFELKKASLNTLQSIVKGKLISIEILADRFLLHIDDGRIFNWKMNSFEDNNFTVLTNTGHYDDDEEAVLKELIDSKDIIFDIGANKGWYTIMFGLLANHGSVHAFEPIHSAYSELMLNISLNSLSNIVCNEVAMSNHIGTAQIHIPYNHSPLASLRKAHETEYKTFECKLLTIDNYVISKSLQHVDLIKIDVEGAELSVIDGGTNFLSRAESPIIMLEVYDKVLNAFEVTPHMLTSKLKSLGYSIFSIENKRLRPILDLYDKSSFDAICMKNQHISRYSHLIDIQK